MNRKLAKEKLEKAKDAIKKSANKYKGLGDKFGPSDNRLLGPKNDFDYHKMKKDIKESGRD